MDRRTWLALLASALVVASCGGGGDSEHSARPASFVQARQQWLSAASANYHYTLARSCFCVPESAIEIQVQAGRATSARFVETGVAVDAQRLATLPTITDLYALLDAAYAQDAAMVRFSIDPAHAYLLSIFIDYNALMADEEVGYTISNFIIDGG
jgi:hypothetical protein